MQNILEATKRGDFKGKGFPLDYVVLIHSGAVLGLFLGMFRALFVDYWERTGEKEKKTS